MNLKYKKYLVVLLLAIESIMLTLTYKSFNNKSIELNNKFENENKNFSMYVQDESTGEYVLWPKRKFPTGNYNINMDLSTCYDAKGNLVDANISYNNNKISVQSNKTIYCKLYFNIFSSLFLNVFDEDLSTAYDGDGSFGDDNEFFDNPIYYWDATTIEKQNRILDKWNVVFAKTCWQIIRTTNNKGLKLLYNGPAEIIKTDTGVNYDCSDNRSSKSPGFSPAAATNISSGSYTYATDYRYDPVANLFYIDGDVVSSSAYSGLGRISQVKNRFTCLYNGNSCSTLRYVIGYAGESNDKNLNIINITSTARRDSLLTGKFSNETGVFDIGYMESDYDSLTHSITQSSASSKSFMTRYSDSTYYNYYNFSSNSTMYFADSYSYNPQTNTYTLSNAQTVTDIMSNTLMSAYTEFLGKYTLLSTNESSAFTTLYYVVAVSNNSFYYKQVIDTTNMPVLYNITTENNQALVQGKATQGSNIKLFSNMDGYDISSFKMNGTTIVGDSFIMPNSNVSITNLKFKEATSFIVESDHYPIETGLSISDGVTFYENTFEGATSINVELKYEMYGSNSNYYVLKFYQANSSTAYVSYYGSNMNTTTITIPGNYLKITFKHSDSYSYYRNVYGFRAVITPNGITTSNEEFTFNGDGTSNGIMKEIVGIHDTQRILSNSITDNNDGTYTLNNPFYVNIFDSNFDINGVYYSCTSNDSICEYNSVRRYFFNNGKSNRTSVDVIFSNSSGIKVATNYTLSGNTVTLNNPITVSTINNTTPNLLGIANDYDNYYFCLNGENSCPSEDIKKIAYITNGTLYYWPVYKFSNNFSYVNGEYILDMTAPNAVQSNGVSTLMRNAHYTCLNLSGICNTINYIYYFSGNTAYYVSLKDGMYVSTNPNNKNEFYNLKNYLYNELVFPNNSNSYVKSLIDAWYTVNLNKEKYSELIDFEEVYCNNKQVMNNDFAGWNLNASSIASANISFQAPKTSISCPNKEDAYSAKETKYGNGELIYPIGLPTVSELYLLTKNDSSSTLLSSSGSFWTGTPISLNYSAKNIYYVTNTGGFGSSSSTASIGVRPMIALNSNVEYTRGDGSRTNPYLVEAGKSIIVRDEDAFTDEKKAYVGENVKVYYASRILYDVTSFKVNNITIVGDTFTMPDNDVVISDVEYVQVGYYITNNDDNVSVPSTARTGMVVTIVPTNSNKEVTSFKLNNEIVTGDSFTMPSGNVTITNIELADLIIVESEHKPYANSINNVVYYENTFEGATSIVVELTYQTESTSYDWIYLYSGPDTIYGNKKYGGTTQKTETITIPGNYLKIVFRTDGGGNNYYGFRALVRPKYD